MPAVSCAVYDSDSWEDDLVREFISESVTVVDEVADLQNADEGDIPTLEVPVLSIDEANSRMNELKIFFSNEMTDLHQSFLAFFEKFENNYSDALVKQFNSLKQTQITHYFNKK